MNLELAERISEANVRICGMWPFPFGEASDALLSAFEGAEIGNLPEPIQALTKGWKEDEIGDLLAGDGWRAREAWNELSGAAWGRNVCGYIITAECPVFKKAGDKSCEFSWGHYRSENLFAANADLAIVAACEWVESEYNKAMGWPS